MYCCVHCVDCASLLFSLTFVSTIGFHVFIISYHTSASGIRKNIVLLHPISNKALQANLTRDIEHTIRMVVILAVQYRFLSPLHSANLIGGLART